MTRKTPSSGAPSGNLPAWVQSQVSPYRFAHIRGVVRTAQKLARKNKLPVRKAVLAAWFHDCAKEWTKDKMRSVLRGSPFRLDSLEKKTPALWHPHAGAAAAWRFWKIRDPEVLEAIRCHTLGHPRMGKLAQALFVADFIEPGRKFEGVEHARRAGTTDLREGVLVKASLTLHKMFHKRMTIHPRLLETWNSFLRREAP